MTPQIPDKVVYSGTEYELSRINGGTLFNPGDYGLHPTIMGSVCHRGFYCEYQVQANGLVLTRAVINTKDEVYPPILGVEAVYESRHIITETEAKAMPLLDDRIVYSRKVDVGSDERKWVVHYLGGIYANLNVSVPFTGGMLLGAVKRNDWLQMGFSAPECFERLIELMLENGQVIAMHDHSARVAAYWDFIAQLDSDPRVSPRMSTKRRKAIEEEFVWHFKMRYPRVAFNYEPVAPP